MENPTHPPLAPARINSALIRSAAEDGWLLFHDPFEILQADTLAEVSATIRRLEEALAQPGISAAGFIAYEAAPAFDPALKTRPPQPGLPLAWFGLYAEPTWLAAPPAVPALPAPAPGLTWQPSTSVAEYDHAIAQIKAQIARGATYQVNHTYRLNASFPNDPYRFFLDLIGAQNAPYAAYLETERFAICSASPELFFQLDGRQLRSIPMKGTAPRGRTLAEDHQRRDTLRASLKEQAENVMIVDMVRNDIGKVAVTGSVQVPALFALEKYPTVWQMVSTVCGETSAGYAALFAALFPPASITGAPKNSTMAIIAELETTPRGLYTGCIGCIRPGRQAQFNVAIRTAVIDKQTAAAVYGIGGGITVDSRADAEYAESRAKAKILSVRIPPFQLLESLRWDPRAGYFLLEHHLQRLAESAAYFSYPVDSAQIRAQLDQFAAGFDDQTRKVRLLVDSRGSAALQAEPIATGNPGAALRVRLAPGPVDSANPFLYHKTTHRAVYDQVKQAALAQAGGEFDEVLLWNERGELTEGCTTNLLLELDGVCCTPPLNSGLLAGTYRAWLLAEGRAEERVLHLSDLRRARRISCINSVRKERQAILLNYPEPDPPDASQR